MPRTTSANKSPRGDPYVIETVWRACDIIEAFQSGAELLRLRDVADRAGLAMSTALRLLHTLELRGFVEKVDGLRYRLRIHPPKRNRYRFGYAAESTEFDFSRAVTQSLQQAAQQEGLDLLVLDNRYSPKVAVRNAEAFIREKCDLVIEFQASERVAPIISSKLLSAGIPVIAVEIPHPGATYYGADNYGAGLLGGRHMGRWAKTHWGGAVKEVLLLELPRAGMLPNARLTGFVDGLREVLPNIDGAKVARLDGDGLFGTSFQAVRKYLQRTPPANTVVGAINDPSAVGALRAFEEAGRGRYCGIVSFNACVEARYEMRQPGTRLIGSVAFFPERYGEALIALASDILNGRSVGPSLFVKHQVVTPDNVNRLYPNDVLVAEAGMDTAMIRNARVAGVPQAETSVLKTSHGGVTEKP